MDNKIIASQLLCGAAAMLKTRRPHISKKNATYSIEIIVLIQIVN